MSQGLKTERLKPDKGEAKAEPANQNGDCFRAKTKLASQPGRRVGHREATTLKPVEMRRAYGQEATRQP